MELVPRYLNFARTYFPDIFFQRPLILFFLKYDNNFLLENDILTQTEIGMAGGNMRAVNFRYILRKLKRLLPQGYLLPAAAKQMRGVVRLPKITADIPAEFDEARVRRWRAIYDSI